MSGGARQCASRGSALRALRHRRGSGPQLHRAQTDARVAGARRACSRSPLYDYSHKGDNLCLDCRTSVYFTRVTASCPEHPNSNSIVLDMWCDVEWAGALARRQKHRKWHGRRNVFVFYYAADSFLFCSYISPHSCFSEIKFFFGGNLNRLWALK